MLAVAAVVFMGTAGVDMALHSLSLRKAGSLGSTIAPPPPCCRFFSVAIDRIQRRIPH
jgi:hypothetical protein